jgi:hypothetical protein
VAWWPGGLVAWWPGGLVACSFLHVVSLQFACSFLANWREGLPAVGKTWALLAILSRRKNRCQNGGDYALCICTVLPYKITKIEINLFYYPDCQSPYETGCIFRYPYWCPCNCLVLAPENICM